MLHYNLPYSFGLWHCLALNYELMSVKHKDVNDDPKGICIILPIGDFVGGNFVLHEYLIEHVFQVKDIYVLDCKWSSFIYYTI